MAVAEVEGVLEGVCEGEVEELGVTEEERL